MKPLPFWQLLAALVALLVIGRVVAGGLWRAGGWLGPPLTRVLGTLGQHRGIVGAAPLAARHRVGCRALRGRSLFGAGVDPDDDYLRERSRP